MCVCVCVRGETCEFNNHSLFRHQVTLHELEGFSLVMLCSCQGIVRKLAVHLLKEIRNLFSILNIPKVSILNIPKVSILNIPKISLLARLRLRPRLRVENAKYP